MAAGAAGLVASGALAAGAAGLVASGALAAGAAGLASTGLVSFFSGFADEAPHSLVLQEVIFFSTLEEDGVEVEEGGRGTLVKLFDEDSFESPFHRLTKVLELELAKVKIMSSRSEARRDEEIKNELNI